VATITLQQTDDSSLCTTVSAFCSGLSVGSGTTGSRDATAGGSAGSSEVSLTTGSAESNSIVFQFVSGELGSDSWESGTWTVNVNCTTSNEDVTLQSIYICRVNSSCTSQETIGSLTSIGQSWIATGTKTHEFTCSASSGASTTDHAVIILAFDSEGHGGKSFGITPSLTIATPVESGPTIKTVTDDGAGTDAPAIGASIPVSDSLQTYEFVGIDSPIHPDAPDTFTAHIREYHSLIATDAGTGDDATDVSTEGGDSTKTVTDGGAGTDTTSTSAIIPVADASAGADATDVPAVTISVTDNNNQLYEFVGIDSPIHPDAPDTFTAHIREYHALTVNETGSGEDSTSVGGAAETITVNDTGGGTDSPEIAVSLGISDAGTGDETNAPAAEVPVSDAGTGADANTVTVTLMVTDAGAGAEATTVPAVTVAFADAGTGADSANIPLVSAEITDIASGTDATSIPFESLTVADTASGTDATSVPLESLTIADTGAGADTAGLTEKTAAVSDTGTGADATTISASLTIMDAGTGVDAILATVLQVITDTASGLDSVSIPAIGIEVSDSGSGTDLVSIAESAIYRFVTDEGSGTDAAHVNVSIIESDAGGGSDAVNVAVTIAVSESGSTVETVLGGTLIAIAEAASGADSIAVAARIEIPDASNAADAIAQINVLTAIADAAGGSDAVFFFDEQKHVLTATFTAVAARCISWEDNTTELEYTSAEKWMAWDNSVRDIDWTISPRSIEYLSLWNEAIWATPSTKEVSDSGTGTDAVLGSLNLVTILDAAGGSDSIIVPLHDITLSDVSFGVETILRSARELVITDAGSGDDSTSIIKAPAAPDTITVECVD